MNELQRLTLVIGVVGLSTVLWLLWDRANRRWSSSHVDIHAAVQHREFPFALGGHATVLQFSTEVCSTCRQAKRIIEPLVAEIEGAVYHELDSAAHLDLVQEFKIMRAPTIILLDSRGLEVGRTWGAPDVDQLRGQLASLGSTTAFEI